MNTKIYKNKTKISSAGTRNRHRRLNKKSSLDPERLIQKSTSSIDKSYTPSHSFEEMNLDRRIKFNLKQKGFLLPTEIQEKTFDSLINGRNLIGIANTGTGKTVAFLLPIVQQLLQSKGKFKTLVIVPTRELALQVQEEAKALMEGLGLFTTCHIGGVSIDKDVRSLKRTNHITIGTPGRLLDLRDRRVLKLNEFDALILDEFDRMLDMGFIKDIRKIVAEMKRRRQTMLFSATKDDKQAKLIEEFVKNAICVKVCSGNTSSKNVDQDIVKIGSTENKYDVLLQLLNKEDADKVILFAETKHLANRLSKRLNNSGVRSDQIHGNKSQSYRSKALSKFKRGSIRILVATDVAARGIDIDDVSHVINYDLPRDYDTYIHRIGRTGRAGKTGTAFTLVEAR